MNLNSKVKTTEQAWFDMAGWKARRGLRQIVVENGAVNITSSWYQLSCKLCTTLEDWGNGSSLLVWECASGCENMTDSMKIVENSRNEVKRDGLSCWREYHHLGISAPRGFSSSWWCVYFLVVSRHVQLEQMLAVLRGPGENARCPFAVSVILYVSRCWLCDWGSVRGYLCGYRCHCSVNYSSAHFITLGPSQMIYLCKRWRWSAVWRPSLSQTEDKPASKVQDKFVAGIQLQTSRYFANS